MESRLETFFLLRLAVCIRTKPHPSPPLFRGVPGEDFPANPYLVRLRRICSSDSSPTAKPSAFGSGTLLLNRNKSPLPPSRFQSRKYCEPLRCVSGTSSTCPVSRLRS